MDVINNVLSNPALWIGLGSVMLFAYSRFNVSLPDIDELSPPLAPRTFTTKFRFRLAAYIYVGVYTFVYFTLLVAGLIPQFQPWLITFFGSLKDAATIGMSVGTPAGAALIATSILPSMPGFDRFDAWLRGALDVFASIPAKAWMIGQEILCALDAVPEDRLSPAASLADIRNVLDSHKKIFGDLEALWDRLPKIDRPVLAERYKNFFDGYEKVADRLRESFAIRPDELTTVDTARYVEGRLRIALGRAAKFTGCALLCAESTEFALRARLREKDIKVAPGAFNFGWGQLIVAASLITVFTFVGVVFATAVYAKAMGMSAAQILSQNLPEFLCWGLVADLTYMLPLVFAAAVEMYLLDRVAQGESAGALDHAATAVLNFIGAAGLAFVAMLACRYLFIELGKLAPGDGSHGLTAAAASTSPLLILPWVLPAATVATIFLVRASHTAVGGWFDMLADGAIHGVGGAAACAISLLLSWLAGDTFPRFPPGLMNYMAPLAVGLIGFCIGAVVCYTARRHARAVQPVLFHFVLRS